MTLSAIDRCLPCQGLKNRDKACFGAVVGAVALADSSATRIEEPRTAFNALSPFVHLNDEGAKDMKCSCS